MVTVMALGRDPLHDGNIIAMTDLNMLNRTSYKDAIRFGASAL